MLREFRVGYSPSAWDRVLLGRSGTASARPSWWRPGSPSAARGAALYDRFRGRIMFPLADARGRVLGFGARAMGEGRGPKYLNTSENEIYHKGRQLFGIDLARGAPPRAVGSWSSRVIRTCWPSTRRGSASPWPSWARR